MHSKCADGIRTERSGLWQTFNQHSQLCCRRKSVSGRLSVGLQRVCTSLDEYGSVRTPPVGSGHGYCVQTVRLGSRRYGHFARKQTKPPSYEVGKDCNLFCLDCTVRWRSPRRMIVQSHRRTLGGSSRKLRNRPCLMEPFSGGYIYIPSLTDSHPV